MESSLIIPAFIAGMLAFLAPCTLPLIPAYLGFLSGVSVQDLKAPRTPSSAKKKLILHGLLFALGFSVPFVVLAARIGFFSTRLSHWGHYLPIISMIGGIFFIFVGILLLTDHFEIWVSYFYQFFGFLRYNRLLEYL